MGLICCSTSFAQSTEGKEKKAPNCWHQMDKTDSGYNGISLAKAYDFIKTKKLKSKKEWLQISDAKHQPGFSYELWPWLLMLEIPLINTFVKINMCNIN